MAIVNRASLPEEFFDVTSPRMLLQPEPQFFFAVLGKLALGSALSLAMGAGGISPDRGIGTSGSDPGPYQASARLGLASADSMSSQAIQMVAELGKAPGHTVRLNRPRYGSGGFTLAAREIASGTTISTAAIDLSSEQVSITLKRYGGPYDAVNSIVAPFAIDKFDASLGLHSLVQYVGLHMQRDFDKWFDAVFSVLLSAGSTTLWPSGFTADNNSQVAGDMPMDADLLFRGYETLKNANIPMFPNGRYRAVISPSQARQVKNDPQFNQAVRYDLGGMNPVTGAGGINPVPGALGSYVGQIAGVDIFESTTLQAAANAQSVSVTTAIMFGPGMVGTGVGQLPQIKYSTDDNYGEHAKLVWLAYLGFVLQDNRFGLQLHTS